MKKKLRMFVKVILAKITWKKNINYHAWVFSSTNNTNYNYNSKYLFEYVRDNLGSKIIPYYVINDDEERLALQKKYGKQYFIETNTIKGIKHVLSCGVWFTSAGLPIYGFNLKKDYTIVNLWHGVPLKKIALMDINISKIGKIYFRSIFSKNYTYILTTSEKLIDIMAESFKVNKKIIKCWGQPRNDLILLERNRDHILNCFYKNLPTYQKIILYAPTFRDYGVTEIFPFKDFSSDEIESFLEDNKIIIFIRSHISDCSSFKVKEEGRIKFINSDVVEDITEYLSIFDLLITDYSSIYIDYLLTKKPIIFLPYDKEKYLKGRGMNFEYDEVTPGPKPEDMKDFLSEIKNSLFSTDQYRLKREVINRYFNEVQQSCSHVICQKIIDELNL